LNDGVLVIEFQLFFIKIEFFLIFFLVILDYFDFLI